MKLREATVVLSALMKEWKDVDNPSDYVRGYNEALYDAMPRLVDVMSPMCRNHFVKLIEWFWEKIDNVFHVTDN